MIQTGLKKYSSPQIRVVDHSSAVVAYNRMDWAAAIKTEPKPMKSNGDSTLISYVPYLEPRLVSFAARARVMDLFAHM
jgi:hypothetical protein